MIVDVAKALGFTTGDFRTGAQVSRRLFEAVPFYAGLTLEEIGGRGVRWVEREAFVSPDWEAAALEIPQAAPAPSDGKLRLGTYRPLWAAKEVDLSPALQFIRARQVAELSPADAAALGINEGDRIEVGNGSRVRAQVKLRDAIPAGSVFLAEGTREDNANVLTHPLVGDHADRAWLRSSRAPCPRRSSPRSRAWPRRRPPPACRSRRERSPDGPRRGRLLRAVVDADPEGDRDLRRRLQPRPAGAARRPQGARAASSTATAPTASARSARCRRSPTSASSSSRPSSGPRAPTAGCSRSPP